MDPCIRESVNPSMLRFECPWLAEEENALLLEALIDNAFPIEYAFVLEAEDARQT